MAPDDAAAGSVASMTKAPAIPVLSEEAAADAAMHAHRAGAYELLGRLLAREPDAEMLGVLASIGEVDTSGGQLAMGWELLRKAGSKADPSAVADEYFALFVGLGRGVLVPFGSWYLTGFLMEKPLAILREDLKQLGIERQADTVESEDHIAALCDAMAIMIRHPDEVSLAQQTQFFNDHIEPWVLRLFSDMQEARPANFYRSVGFFGMSFFEFEQRLLSMQS